MYKLTNRGHMRQLPVVAPCTAAWMRSIRCSPAPTQGTGTCLSTACCRRLVALSSTSRFTKQRSSDAADREVASRLVAAEEALLAWSASRSIRATILRPTLIYDGSADRNITTIAGFIRRFGFFPILGEARGLRQPVHVEDLVAACIAALTAASPQPAYEISGAEVLSYRSMLERVFAAQGVAPRLLSLPGWLIRAAMPLATALPRYRDLSPAMFERMNEDLVFDHAAAARDLGFSPRPFTLPSGQSGKHALGIESIPRAVPAQCPDSKSRRNRLEVVGRLDSFFRIPVRGPECRSRPDRLRQDADPQAPRPVGISASGPAGRAALHRPPPGRGRVFP
jgi:hypothetical protein